MMKNSKIICWWSGGVTSAVACKLAIELFCLENCMFVFIDPAGNEHEDTYRFKEDCERWYGAEILTITNEKYSCIQDIWRNFQFLNGAHGAICSSELKREVRIAFQKKVDYRYQVFGFDIDEPKRAKAMTLNYPETNPVYPLLMFGYTKKRCIQIIEEAGIRVPEAYYLGLNNNNCLKTGCVQGGIGYWKLMQKIHPEKFDAMAAMEHELTNTKGEQVTCLKDQSKKAKEGKEEKLDLVFLKPHPMYPFNKDISMMSGREPEPLMECNGFCGTYDLNNR